jgi:hypothetical protein
MKKTFIILLLLVLLVPVASANAQVLLEDNFDDGNFDCWVQIQDPVWEVIDGHLQSDSPVATYIRHVTFEFP